MKKAQNTPESQWPTRRKRTAARRNMPDRKALIKKLRDESAALANKLNINPSILATRAAITAIAYADPHTIDDIIKCANNMRWQAELLHPIIKRTMKKLETQPEKDYKEK
jgi:ribonuclease D